MIIHSVLNWAQCILSFWREAINFDMLRFTACDSSCASCFPDNPKCMSCQPGTALHHGICISQCPLQHYMDNHSRCRGRLNLQHLINKKLLFWIPMLFGMPKWKYRQILSKFSISPTQNWRTLAICPSSCPDLSYTLIIILVSSRIKQVSCKGT